MKGHHPLSVLLLFLMLGLSGAAFWTSLFSDKGMPGDWGGFLFVFYVCWKAITGD